MIGYVYKIISNQTDKCYVGSTIKNINQRFRGHKNNYKLYVNGYHHYTTAVQILQYDDAEIILIDEIEFEDKKTLTELEGKYMRELNCVNKFIPNRTQKEHYEENKEKIKEQSRQYRENNKDKLKEKRDKKYAERYACDCGSIVIVCCKSRHDKTKKHLDYINNN